MLISYAIQVWQYITLTRKIYLIDCPGIVPTSARNDSHTATVLKGVVRVEALPTPSEHIPALMERMKPLYLSRTYGVPLPDEDDTTKGWEPEEFLDKLARMKGRLLKGGEPDLEAVAKIILSDWVRGRIPFFVPPPERSAELNAKEEKERKRAKGKEKERGKALGNEMDTNKIGSSGGSDSGSDFHTQLFRFGCHFWHIKDINSGSLLGRLVDEQIGVVILAHGNGNDFHSSMSS